MALVSQTSSKSFDSFLESVYIISHSIKTVKTYRTSLNHLQKFIDANYEQSEPEILLEIKSETIDLYQFLRDFVIYLDKAGIQPKGLRGYLSGVKGYLRHQGIRINSDDFKQFVKIPKLVRTREIPLTKEMLLRVLHNSNSKLQTAILVALSSGLRIGELVQLKLSDIDFESNPTKISVRGNATKTRQSRETYITPEATNALKDYLSRYFGWTENNSRLIDPYIFGPTTGKGRKSKLPGFNVESAKLSLQKSLRTHVGSIPDLDVDNENGYKAIHFHAFRKFFRTIVGNAVGRDYAEALMGHGFYMDTYYQLPEDKKKLMYLDAEPYLTISDTVSMENNLKSLSGKYTSLETKVDDLLRYLQTKSIKVPDYLR
jgi:integrase